jgi:uroporphyrinogen decarboxylase
VFNQLETFRATMTYQKHDRFLFYADFTPDLQTRIKQEFNIAEGTNVREALGMFAPVHTAPQGPADLPKTDFSRYFKDVNIPEKAFINWLGVLEIPGSMYHFTEYVSPLRNAQTFEEIKAFPYPTSTKQLTIEHMAAQTHQIHSQGKVAVTWVGHMYENSWQVRGYEEFLMDMLTNPEWCEYILDRFTERNLFCAQAAARAGVDFIQTGDDVANQNAMMFAPDQWRKFMKPRWGKVYAAAKAIKPDIHIWYHSDGNIDPIIPDLIEIGVNILNPVQPECLDPVMVKKKYGTRLILDGTIGTQTTMPFGTPDEVRRVVHERVTTLGQDGALILSPTHILEPEVPLPDIKAFLEAATQRY